MTTPHTPGPWLLEDRGSKFIVSKPGDGYITRDVCRLDGSTMSAIHQAGNARLIAEAPVLLALVRGLRAEVLRLRGNYPLPHDPGSAVMRAADAVIARIEG